MAGSDRPGTLIPAAALVALLLFDLLRVWLPSLLFTVEMSTWGRITIALVVTAVAPIVVGMVPKLARRDAWMASVGILVLARLSLQLDVGGAWMLVASSIAVIAAALALGVLSGLGRYNGDLRFSVLTGFAASGVIHAGLGMTDLIWRSGALAWGATLVLLLATGYTAWQLETPDTPEEERGAARWPWWLFGPILLLLGSLVFVPGRIASAVHWSDPVVAATTVVAAGFLLVAVTVGRWFGPATSGPAGAALTLVGTAGALQPTSWVAVASQLCLAAGLGLLAASMDRVRGTARPASVAAAVAGFPMVFLLLAILFYLPYGISLPFPNRAVLLLAAVGLSAGGIWAGAAREREVIRERGILRRVANAMAVTAVFALLAGSLVGSSERGPAASSEPGEPIRVALVNVQSGFEPDGRLGIHRLGEQLAAEDPDIVILNEVDRGWLATGGRDTLRQLSAHLELSYVFGPAADEMWGNAILSRYPVAEWTVERLPRGSDPMGRSQLIAVLDVTAQQQIAVIATQLSEVDGQGDTRLPQARALAATMVRLQERDVPVLIGGTLHAGPESAELESLTDSTRSVLPQGHPTWPAADPEHQLGHILTTEELRLRDARVLETDLTDHQPIITLLDLAP